MLEMRKMGEKVEDRQMNQKNENLHILVIFSIFSFTHEIFNLEFSKLRELCIQKLVPSIRKSQFSADITFVLFG